MSNNHVSVRLDAETMARVDALAPLFSTRWRRATRSDILRALILSALDRYERAQPSLSSPEARRAAPAEPPAAPAATGPAEARGEGTGAPRGARGPTPKKKAGGRAAKASRR